MKVLILSCNTGAGHNACAAAIQETLMERGVPCDIRDGLSFLSKEVSRFISEWHVRFYRAMPKLYGEGYRYAERHVQPMEEDSAIHRLLTSGAKRMRKTISAQGYTHVVCTHLFPAMILTMIQREHPLPIQTAFVATDYTASPGYDSVAADWIFIPDESIAGEFERPDVPRGRIVPSGIPVRKAFHTRVDPETAKRALGIDPAHRHLLVMSGSMGCGPVKRILKIIAEDLAPDTEISVICGSNRKLTRQLSRSLGTCERIHIHDFVDHVPLFMDSADLFLTKPGGLSVSESMAKRLPMVLLQAVEGCEPYNLTFCVDHGVAVTADRPAEVAALCKALIENEASLANMRRACEQAWQKHPAQTVCDCLIGVPATEA